MIYRKNEHVKVDDLSIREAKGYLKQLDKRRKFNEDIDKRFGISVNEDPRLQDLEAEINQTYGPKIKKSKEENENLMFSVRTVMGTFFIGVSILYFIAHYAIQEPEINEQQTEVQQQTEQPTSIERDGIRYVMGEGGYVRIAMGTSIFDVFRCSSENCVDFYNQSGGHVRGCVLDDRIEMTNLSIYNSGENVQSYPINSEVGQTVRTDVGNLQEICDRLYD